jgi:hypothetical protein
MESRVDHIKDDTAVTADDGYVVSNGNRQRKLTTKGWKLCVKWKDGSTSWEALKDLKESNATRNVESFQTPAKRKKVSIIEPGAVFEGYTKVFTSPQEQSHFKRTANSASLGFSYGFGCGDGWSVRWCRKNIQRCCRRYSGGR